MNIAQFQLLNDAEKEEAVWEYGSFLINYDHGNILCDAYEVFDFYVAFCYKLNVNERAVITAHIHADELPYVGRAN